MIFALAALPGSAGGDSFRFRQISTGEGLSQSTVSCMLQDHLGYLWVGTFDGLNRYDGYGFTSFKNIPNDPTSLGDNRILALFEDQEHRLWIGTDGGGLNLYDRKTGQFTKFLSIKDDPKSLSDNRVRAITTDAQGRLWVGTGGGGLARWDGQSGFTVYRRSGEDNSLSHNRVRVLLCDREGRLWIGTGGGGLNLYIPEIDAFKSYQYDEFNPQSISDDQINALLEDPEGGIWVGTYSGGLNRFDPEKETFVAYRHAADFHTLVSDMVNALYRDSFGHMWVATDQGLDRFDTQSQTFTHFSHDPANPDSLSDHEIVSLYQDRSGVFWVGTRNGGLNKFERGKQSFQLFTHQPDNTSSLSDNRISALYQDRDGVLWVGTNGSGLNRQNPDGSFTHYVHRPEEPASLNDNRVLAIRKDTAQNLWVGTSSGLDLMTPGAVGAFEHFVNDPLNPESLCDNQIWTLLVDSKGTLWIGTENGLDYLTPGSRVFQHHRQDESQPTSLSHNVIWCLAEDRQGRLWVGTENGGLSRMDTPGVFTTFRQDETAPNKLSNNTVLALYPQEEFLWVGTWGGGLNKLNLKGEPVFQHYREKDGLPNDIVYGILGDERGNLWVSTNRGLAFFNPTTGGFRAFTTNDGLQGDEFNPGAAWRGEQGEMFFGGDNGFNAFHPDHFRGNMNPPQVVVTAFRNHDLVIAKDIEGTSKFTLEPHQNDLSFEVAAFDFHDPEANRFAYKLEGVDQDWYTGRDRIARYNALKPGSYTFRVKASNNDNIWNEAGVSIDLKVKSPFIKSPLGIALVISIAVLSVVVLFLGQRWEIRREEEKKLVALELKSKTEELEEARRLQLSMLPTDLPNTEFFEMAVAMETASQVGGDYYDFYAHCDGDFTMAIGDATGHGLKAGTMVAAAKGMFLTLVPDQGPICLLQRASRVMRKMGFKKMFMAMAIARFRGRQLTVAIAGMPAVCIYHARESRLETIALRGLPLGGVDFPYQEKTLTLEPGDVILFQSDGLEEMFNVNNQMLGADAVRKVFLEHVHLPPQAVITELLAAGKAWAGGRPQCDDITLIVIKVK